MDYRNHITVDPNKRGGKPCVRGLSITVYEVLEYLASDMKEAEILEDFPDLTREDLKACIAYAADRERWLMTDTFLQQENDVMAKRYFNRGLAFSRQKRYQEAIFEYQKAIEINPKYAKAHYNLAGVFKQLQQYDQAIYQYEKAIKANTDYAKAHYKLGIMLYELEEFSKALIPLEKAIELDHQYKNIELYYKLYRAYDFLGDYDKAFLNYEKIISLNDEFEKNIILSIDYAEVCYEQGKNFQEKGESSKAIAYYEKSVAINPNFIKAHDDLKFLLSESIINEENINIATNPEVTDGHVPTKNHIGHKNISSKVKLTESQLQSFDKMINFLSSSAKYFRLTGYAGTGKSFLISELIKNLSKKNNYRFCLAGPTHKSVKNLKSLIASNVEAQTLARLLGKRPQINYENGEETFIQIKEVNLSELDLVIVDEFSMINENDFEDLINESERNRFKIIFVGDAAQLPPVGEELSIVANHHEIRDYAELTEVVRYDGEIARVAEEIRSNNRYRQQTYRFRTSDDESVIVLPKQEWLKTAIQHFANEWSKNPDSARIICWRNKTLADFNQQIRKAIHGDNVPLYIPGDLLICRKPLFRKSPNATEWECHADNRSEFLVLEEPELIQNQENLNYYLISTQGEDGNNYFLRVLTPESMQEFEQEQQKLKNQAKEAKDAGRRYKHFWARYYDRQKWFDDIAHAMSITAHSAQGSSIDNVFLYAHEMRWCEERQKILYTALTRARKKVYVCQDIL